MSSATRCVICAAPGERFSAGEIPSTLPAAETQDPELTLLRDFGLLARETKIGVTYEVLKF